MYSTTGTSPLTEEQDQPLPPISVQYPSSQTPKTSFLKMGLLLGMTGKQQEVICVLKLMRQVSKARIIDSRCLEEPKDKPQISKHCTGPVLVPQQFAPPFPRDPHRSQPQKTDYHCQCHSLATFCVPSTVTGTEQASKYLLNEPKAKVVTVGKAGP